MASAEYEAYIQSDKWKIRRLSKLESAGFRCEKCGERDGLEVHHRTYKRLGEERSGDLEVLCKSCHYIADRKRIGHDNEYKSFYAPHNSKRQIRLAKKTQGI